MDLLGSDIINLNYALAAFVATQNYVINTRNKIQLHYFLYAFKEM